MQTHRPWNVIAQVHNDQSLLNVWLQVHRLDEATGGLLVVAKSRQGLKGLSAAFEHRQVG